MPDAVFDFEFVPRDAVSKAGRIAVLKPFCSNLDLAHDESVRAAVNRVVKLWRRRCNHLRDLEWEPATGRQHAYMRNCPPTCVGVGPREDGSYWRACQKQSVCPWCWDRLVVRRTCEAVLGEMGRTGCLPDPVTRRHPDDPPYKLCLLVYRGSFPDGDGQPKGVVDQVLARMTAAAHNYRRKAHRWAQLGTVWPKKGGGWSYSCRYLVMVTADYPVPEAFTVLDAPTRRAVAGAVGRFARYPASWLFGKPEEQIRILEARAGKRLLRFGGALSRNRGNPREGDAQVAG